MRDDRTKEIDLDVTAPTVARVLRRTWTGHRLDGLKLWSNPGSLQIPASSVVLAGFPGKEQTKSEPPR